MKKDKIFNHSLTSVVGGKDTFVQPLLNGPITRLEENNVRTIVNDETKESTDTSEALVDIPILDIEQQENDILSDSTKKVDLHIIQTSNESAYFDVENRFHESHDINDALFFSKKLFSKKKL